ncbi:LamG-like jellyroll fold domain-containing protein [Glycomyces salinus]|uniref:LamG-like jellyroll fold domain-containing protein n=1 Tax=Glycomyces salinus TaxID=980294 RepID=UPI0018EB3147|nr:LamG-like jellyroll fold domain-containing protein [Glycomyces salinus]
MTATLLTTPPAFAQDTIEEGIPPGSASSDIATDGEIADAQDEAAATGQNVKIESLGSADSEVFAAPDGTFVEQVALEPFQSQLPDGTWAPIDNTLTENADDQLVPVHSDSGLELSGGGDTVLATLTDIHGRSVSYTWHEALPEPTVEGDTATYPEVIPDVDLKIRATNDGFAKIFEIKTPEAASSVEVASIDLGVELDGFSAGIGTNGALEISDYSGEVVYSGPTPMMWDATGPDDGAGDADSDGWSPTTFAHLAEVATNFADGVLTLTPDQALLTDPDAVYPLRIDPKWVNVKRSHWAMVSDWPSYRNHNYYDGGSFEKSPSGTARLGRAHKEDGSREQTWRLAFEFPTSKFRGKDILDANLNLQMTYSWLPHCDGVTPSYGIYELDANLKTWTWNNNGSWGTKLATRDEGVGQGCAAPRDIVTDVTDYVDDVATTNDSSIQFGLRVANEDACCESFRRFGPEKTDSGAGGVSLSVKYNTAPNKPGSFTIDGQRCTANSTVKLGAGVSWPVSAKFSDAEGDNMTGVLKWKDQDSDATETWTTSAAHRERSNWTVHADELSGNVYTATAAGRDTGGATGAASGGCTVIIDSTPPEPPTVTSTDYPDDDLPHGSVGKTGRFNVQSISDDTAGYKWSLQQAGDTGDPLVSETTVPVGTPGSGATITFDPPTSGKLTLSVWAYDAHGNTSDRTDYFFRVDTESDPVAHWKLDEGEGTTAADQDYDYEGDLDRPLTLDGPAWGGGSAADAANDHLNYLTFDGVDDEATTSETVLDTSVSYTVSASIRLHETDVDYTIASQDGQVNSGFMLKYDGEDQAFLFTVCNLDTNEPGAGLHCPSTGTAALNPEAGVWYTVTAVYEYSNSRISLYVDGQLQVNTTIDDSFDADGPFVIGRDLYGGTEGTHFAGDIDEVKVWDRKLAPGEVARFGQRAEGIWDFNSIDFSFDDQSGRQHTLSGTDVELVEGVEGQALGLNGSTSTAVTSTAVLDTAGDFTIGSWVKLDRTDSAANIISQDGDYVSPFYFGYLPATDRWTFRAPSQDASGYSWTTITADADVKVGRWTHLAVAYEAATGKVTLYVDGKPFDNSETTFDLWSSDGPLRIGSVWHADGVTDHWPGAIDNVNVNTGVADNQQVETLADITVRETHSDLITGEFTGDGIVDALAIVNNANNDSDVYLLTGDGNGEFTRSERPVFQTDLINASGERQWRLDDAIWRVGDINGDGRDDLVLAVPGDGEFEVWALRTCGRFDHRCGLDGEIFATERLETLELSADEGWELSDTQIQLEDLTGDEKDDLVLMRGDGTDAYSIWVSELTTDDPYRFQTPTQIADGTGDSRQIELAVADFDNDWWGDVAEIRTGPDGSADIYVRYGSADGLAEPVLAVDTPNNWQTNRDHVTIADVTGDGLPDLIAAYQFGTRIRLQVSEALPDQAGFSSPKAWAHSGRCTGCQSDLNPWPHTRLATGDIDGDGDADLLTLSAGINGDIGALWTRESTGARFADPTPTWADPETCFGVDGDVNGDGYADAVLPYSNYAVEGIAGAGAIWFVDGATGQVSLVHQNTSGVNGAAEEGDQFGFAVDTYDENGDGCAEIVVGIPGENSGQGYVQIIPGKREGGTSGDYLMSQNTPGIPGANEAGDQFGYSLAATNLTDGTPVLAVGVPGEDVQIDTTGAYRDGDSRGVETQDGGALIYIQGDSKSWVDQDTPGVGGGVEEGDQFGWSVAASPNGLIVGAPFEDTVSNTESDAGGALVFNHNTSPEGWPTYLTWLDQNDTYMNGAPEAGDRLGYNVAAIDYWDPENGAWTVETLFAISTPWEDINDPDTYNEGVVTVVKQDNDGDYSNAGHYYQGHTLGEDPTGGDHLGITVHFANLDPTSHATNDTLKLMIGVPDENYATGDDDGLVHITGSAEPAADIDTTVTYSDPSTNGKFGTGLGFTQNQVYITAPGTGGLYTLNWADCQEGTTQTASKAT